MKTLRCPLCGNELTSIFRMTKTGSLKNKYGCLICGWETFELRKNENLAWKDAKEFISKFPPIMRAHQGDNLKLDFEDDVLTLIGKVKGVLKSVEIVLKQREEENETDA